MVEGEDVVQVLVPAQVRVDPVGEGELLLRPHRVRRAWADNYSYVDYSYRYHLTIIDI